MITLGSDGSVQTSDDFNRLKTQYGQVSPPNSPSKSSAGSTSFPSCPQQNSTFLASTTLPPTPNDAACACLESALSCQFTPKTVNVSDIVGPLLDTACSLLGQAGGSCDQISGNGSSGTYGAVSACDPSTKLSFVMTQFYEANNRNPQSCSFAGNATVNSQAPSSASAANSVASSCLANPSATFVPSAPASTAGGSGSGSSSTGGSNGNNNAAVSDLLGSRQAWVGVGAGALISVVGGLFTLL
ncbi:hypothetical protein QCA50_001498 [Cerrena zonata]|uniref:X8 domain-containing protein n=1 Tax=Cerrena zonata TaxID=2478898 RepID=A0AAW0GNI2_9APHY